MKAILISVGLLGLLLLLSPISRAAPLRQSNGTIPTATATPVVVIEEVSITPAAVVAGDEFGLSLRLRNAGTFEWLTLAITIDDQEASWALVAVAGSKTVYQSYIGAGGVTQDVRRFIYQTGNIGERHLVVTFEYSYQQETTVVSAVQVETIALTVLPPTPTPTPTPTLTATATPTPTPTATPLPSPTVPPPPVAPAMPTAETGGGSPPPSTDEDETPGNSTGNDVSPNTPERGAASPSEPVDASLIVVLEFTTPIMVQPGQLFIMDMTVRNLSALTLTQVLLEWQGCAQPVIAPVGGGQWYFTHPILPQSSGTIRQQFFVVESAPGEAQECVVLATFAHESGRGQQEGQVYLWVQEGALLPQALPPTATATLPATPTPLPTTAPEGEPFWLRLLRFFMGQ
jgi:hypothetical protein